MLLAEASLRGTQEMVDLASFHPPAPAFLAGASRPTAGRSARASGTTRP
jgi:hypothetical protein